MTALAPAAVRSVYEARLERVTKLIEDFCPEEHVEGVTLNDAGRWLLRRVQWETYRTLKEVGNR